MKKMKGNFLNDVVFCCFVIAVVGAIVVAVSTSIEERDAAVSTAIVEEINPLEDFITDGCVSKYGEFACQVPEK